MRRLADPAGKLAALPTMSPNLAEAFLREATITAEMTREWVVNLGRRTANQRIAHMLCELCFRMDAMGRGSGGVYPFPFTQQDIADAQGLSLVHTNRVIQHLRSLGIIELNARKLTVLDRGKLVATAGGFDPDYLHYRSPGGNPYSVKGLAASTFGTAFQGQ